MGKAFSQTDYALQSDRGLVAGWLLLIGILFTAVWGTWAFAAHVTRYEISDSARLEVTGAAAPVEASVSGEVAASHLMLGQAVRQGDVLLELNDGEQQLTLKQEQTRRAELLPQLAALRMQAEAEDAGRRDDEQVLAHATGGAEAQLRQAQSEANLAEEEAHRAGKLRAEGLISEADGQKARAAAESKRAAVAAIREAGLRLRPELKLRNSDRTGKQRQIATEMAKVEAAMAESGAIIERLRYEIERRKVRAATSGTLLECAVLRAGAHINEGQRLGMVLASGRVQVIADFNPASAFGKLRVGQHASIRLSGFPWAQFGALSATVSRVAGEIRDGKVRVELALNEPAAGRVPLQHGLPGTVEVEVERITPAAMLLRSAGEVIGAP